MGSLVDSLVIGKAVVIRAMRKVGVVWAVGKVAVRAVKNLVTVMGTDI